MLRFLVHVLFTFYIQGVLEFLNKFGGLRVKSVFGRYVLECFKSLGSFGFFLKCFEGIPEEDCDAEGIYVVLQNQRWGKRFEYCWWVV